jgi:hypothetical protein
MADYHAILKRAISALPEPTGEARRTVYEKARTALVNQLKSFDPPLSASDITQQRLQLEDAIRKVEAEAAKGILSQALNRVQSPPAAAPSKPAPAEPVTGQPGGRPVAEPVTGQRPVAEPVTGQPGGRPVGEAVTGQPGQRRAGEPVTGQPAAARLTPPAKPAAKPEPVAREFDRPLGRVEEPNTGQRAAAQARPADKSPPPPAAPSAGAEALKSAVGEADRLGQATAETHRRARDAMGASNEPPPEPPAPAVDADEPAAHLRGKDRKAQRAERRAALAAEQAGKERRSSLPLLLGLGVAGLVAALGLTAVWTKRDVIATYLGTVKQQVDLPIRSGADTKALPPKSNDRLGTDDGSAAKSSAAPPPATGTKSVPTTAIVAAPEIKPGPAAAAVPPVDTAPPPAAGAPAGASTVRGADGAPSPIPSQSVPLVAQRATLLEEGATATEVKQTAGKVVWQISKESSQAGRPPQTLIRGRVEIPDRRMNLLLTIQPNTDTTFPASHLIELRFEVPPDFDNKGISNVPGLIMKTNEQVRGGDPLVGAAARISSGFFWVALAAPDADKLRNLALLKDRGWIDIPILYDNGKKAILTLEKAGAGDRIVADALAAWAQGG